MTANFQDLAASWGVSTEASKVHQDAYVWDNTLPWSREAKPDIRVKHLLIVNKDTFVILEHLR